MHRYSVNGIDPNMSALLSLIVLFLLCKDFVNSKYFVITIFLAGILIVLFTGSRSGLLILIFYLLFLKSNFSQIKVFFIILFILILNYLLSLYIFSITQTIVLTDSIIDKIIELGFNHNQQYPQLPENPTRLVKILDISNYTRFNLNGFSLINIFNNYHLYILPDFLRDKNNIDIPGHEFNIQMVNSLGFIFYIIFLINIFYITKYLILFRNFFGALLIGGIFLGNNLIIFTPIIFLYIIPNRYLSYSKQ